MGGTGSIRKFHVRLPAAVKLVVPSSVIPSLIQALAQSLSNWQAAQHGQEPAAAHEEPKHAS